MVQVLELGALADKSPDKETPSAALLENLTFLVELLQSCRHERWRQLIVLKVRPTLTPPPPPPHSWPHAPHHRSSLRSD